MCFWQLLLLIKAKNGQAALCLWTSADAWPIAVASIRQELRLGTVTSFTEPHLRESSSSVLRIFRALNPGDDGDRPAKRRKTLPNTLEDVNKAAYQELRALLVGSSQESPVLNLADFHNIIQ
jgi:serine/threonine-protein kinase ATR